MSKRILVIDDDEDILEIFRMVFQEEGYEVIISNSAHAAEHIHFIKPDLILLDFRLAGSARSGADICKEFKSAYPEDEVAIILISAEYDIHTIAQNCGANSYIRKPFDLHKLIKQVAECMVRV